MALLVSSTMAWADANGSCGDNLTWTYNSSTGALTITGTGAMTDYDYWGGNYAPWYEYRESITSVTIADGVTTIGKYAFRDCNNSNLTSVTIPSSVTDVYQEAFNGCSNLVTVTFKGTTIGEKGIYAFHFCSSSLVILVPTTGAISTYKSGYWDQYKITTYSCGTNLTWSYDSPTKTLTVTGTGAMTEWGNLNEVPWNYFDHVITTVSLPEGLTNIGAYAFCQFTTASLTTNIPSSVESIGTMAFYGSPISSIIIPEGVTSIGELAFTGCSKLNSINIPKSVTSIGVAAFAAPGLTSITVNDENTVYKDGDANAIIETSSNTLIAGCKNSTIPNTVKSIGNYAFYMAFYMAQGLPSIVIPDGVTSIGEFAFGGCTALTEMTIPSSVTSIGERAFYYCTDLATVTFEGASLNTYGVDAFTDCEALTAINVPGGSIDEYAAGWSGYVSKLKGTWTSNQISEGDFAGYWATYYNGVCNVAVDNNTQIYYISAVNGTSATLTENTDDKVITAGQAVVLKSTASPITLTYSANASGCAYTANKLAGVDAATSCEANSNYTLANVSGLGFYKFSGTTLAANKAYLPGSAVDTANSRGLTFSFGDDNTTGISGVAGEAAESDAVYYDLQGRRVDQPTKGLYIRNGKKIVVK